MAASTSSNAEQTFTGFPVVETIDHGYLEGNWPVLEKASKIPPYVFETIRREARGSSISSHVQYLSLGYFLIKTSLLEPHPTQRPINQQHVKNLSESFLAMGIHRLDNPGVVIGLGEGWYEMKKNTQRQMLITKDSPHLLHLALKENGPIGQIIRGGHRTKAMSHLSSNSVDHKAYDYWYYQVLVPGMLSEF